MGMSGSSRVRDVVLYHGDVLSMLKEECAQGAKLTIADPPWDYNRTIGKGVAQESYDVLGLAPVLKTLEAAFESAADDSYLLLWWTWPKLVEIMPALANGPWIYKSGGAWTKSGLGVGFHLRGDCEPFAIFVKGNPKPAHRSLSNSIHAKRRRHSEKPVEVLRLLIEGLTRPGDKVVSLYSGLFPEGRVCLHLGRACVGAEIDEIRFLEASCALASWGRVGA